MAGVIDKYAAGMFKRQEQYAQRVKGLYDIAVGKLTALAAQIPYDPDHEFSFSDNPRIADETTRIIRELYSQVYNQIKSGVEAEWELANLSCDALITSIFGAKIKETNLGAQWFARNQKAMDAFFARKSANEGLNLSQKVWKYTGDLRTELENAISVSMGEGVSAATMSRRVRQYLREPDKLFRRVKGKDGKLHLSKAAKAYHPSRGVYRSSYKNAMRLTRTETNMAYRMADEDRWQRMDFVVGYEVKTSNNHPEPDICDDLKGKYPKGFVFKGWHPQCRCRIVPILATKGEFINLQRIAISGGDARGFVSKNHVASVPSGFTKWIQKNEKRILAAKSKPYFVRDNFIGGDIRNGLTNAVLKAGLMPKNGQLPTIKNVKIEPTASDDRKRLMAQATQAMAGLDVNDALQKRIEAAQALQNSADGELFIKAYNRLMAGIETQKKWDALVWQGITPEQKANLKELEKALGIKKGRPMTHEQADTGMVNPLYDNPANYGKNRYKLSKSGRWVKNPEWDDQYSVNCQTCAPVYLLRRWGFNIEAMGNPKGRVWGKDILNNDYTRVWMNHKGEYGYGFRFRQHHKTEASILKGLDAEPDGIYQVECTWKGAKSGHTWVYVKRDGKGFMYDPQTNSLYDDAAFKKHFGGRVSPKYGYSYFRTDDLRVNVDALKQMVKEAEQRKPSVQDIAKARHAKRDEEAIKAAWRERLKDNIRAEYKKAGIVRNDALKERARSFLEAIKADDAAAIRSAYYRTLDGIKTQKAWDVRRANMESIQNMADKVLKFKGKYIEVDTTKLESLMKYRMHKASGEIARLEQELSKIEQFKADVADLIPEAEANKYLMMFTRKEIEDCYRPVKAKIEEIISRGGTDLNYIKDKLEFEANYVKTHPKYKTSALAQKIYERKAAEVQKQIDWKDVKDGLANAVAFKTRSAEYKALVDELDDAIQRGDKDGANIALAKVHAKQAEILSKRAKKAGTASSGAQGETPKTLEHLGEAISKYKRSGKYGKFEREHAAEIEAKMREVFAKHSFGMNIDDNVLELVEQSKFKNTFETGSSGGYRGSSATSGKIEEGHMRLGAAHKMFGLSSDLSNGQLARAEYEKYGSLLDSDIAASLNGHNPARHYGNVEVRFKKDKVKCTWTAGDSLGLDFQPSLVTDPKAVSFDKMAEARYGRKTPPTSTTTIGSMADFRSNHISGYLELQYHGELTLDCVESVAFPYDVTKNARYMPLAQRLKARGIQVYYKATNGDVVQL